MPPPPRVWPRRFLRLAVASAVATPPATYAAAELYYQPRLDKVYNAATATPEAISDATPTPSVFSRGTDLPVAPSAPQKWEDIRPTLKPGDIVLLMGTGTISRRITALSFLRSGWDARSLRYSHVGVVVPGPAPAAGGASSSQQQRPLYLLEAIDNQDIQAPDMAFTRGDDKVVRFDSVQLTDIDSRVFGKEGDRRCYSRCAVRRLEGWDWEAGVSKEEAEYVAKKRGKGTGVRPAGGSGAVIWKAGAGDRRSDEAVATLIRRPLDKSFKVVLANLWPRLRGRVTPTEQTTCSEVVARYLLHVGVLRWSWNGVHVHRAAEGVYSLDDAPPDMPYDDAAARTLSLIQVSPYHFAQGFRLPHVTFGGRGVGYGPEIPIDMSSPPAAAPSMAAK